MRWLAVMFMLGLGVGEASARWRVRRRAARIAKFRAESARRWDSISRVAEPLTGPPPPGARSAFAASRMQREP